VEAKKVDGKEKVYVSYFNQSIKYSCSKGDGQIEF